MNQQIYFPHDLIRRLKKQKNIEACLLGYKYGPIYIIVQLVESDVANRLKHLPPTLKDLSIIGSINQNTYDLKFKFSAEFDVPTITEDRTSFSVVFFEPPNFKNLEYFSIDPILLQSTSIKEHNLNRQEDHFRLLEKSAELKYEADAISDGMILERINKVLRLRISLAEILQRTDSVDDRTRNGWVYKIKHFFLALVVRITTTIQYVCIWLIYLINYKVFHVSLVDYSQVFKQLDLRLKQINYFPIQFLCYYDKSILYEDSILLVKLQLPIFNSNLNINNSNYINLYNSIWLIVNDVLLGWTMYKFVTANIDFTYKFLHQYLIKNILFDVLFRLISWVSFHHPAGFKLNSELGTFIGDLFLWTLKFWKILFSDFIEETLSSNMRFYVLSFAKGMMKVLCTCGITFVFAFSVDVIQVLTFHLYCFYYTSSRIYQKQISIIKSLFQLFRGKKYNVLRNRIDNMNNYLSQGDIFEIDQLLLGTLMFMILIFLLPTVFAFYLMFFLSRLLVLGVLNLIENLMIIINFTPLFVLLLKFKNSNRLQGGITFTYVRSIASTDYLKLSNKSLSYKEIFQNFIKLPTTSKSFRYDLFLCFVRGEVVFMKRNHDLKFQYLMLPKHYERTTDIWKYFQL
ncbi:uncharacterized protein PRCAT00005359001 [Priceomyces carsonii]|uniref:uncharacterized protein n=1 Tax=Priceomyces carsonii TaxID=28549 RepID=UPI002EDA88D1|nr:unnamed protein product [Priceomyces carsonii]